MVMLSRKRVMAAKIESTPGTAIALAASDAVMNISEAKVLAEIAMTERPPQSAFSQLPSIRELGGGGITFKTDLYGDGAAGTPAWASILLPACGGVVTTGTYNFVTEAPGSNVKTVTIATYIDGEVKKLAGAMGTFKIICETGKIVMLEWTFRGKWVDPVDTAILAPTYPTIKPLRFANGTFTIASWVPKVAKLEIDLGAEIILREDAAEATATGISTALITNRKVVGNFDPEMELIATEDYHADWKASTEQALSLALTDGTDTITIAAPKLQYTNIQEGDRNGVAVEEIDFQCNRSASAGDDELTIDFS